MSRLIFGNSQGIWSVEDDDGVAVTPLGTSPSPADPLIPQICLARESHRRPSACTVLRSSSSAQQSGRSDGWLPLYRAAQDVGGPGSDPGIFSKPQKRCMVWTIRLTRARSKIAPQSASTSRAQASFTSTLCPVQAAITRTSSRQVQVGLLRMVVSAERSACCKQPRICLRPIPSDAGRCHQLYRQPGRQPRDDHQFGDR